MTTTHDDAFEHTSELLSQGNWKTAIDLIAERLRETQRYSELFEILKSRIRLEMGLSLDFEHDSESLTEEQHRELEERLLSTCLEIGRLLVENGKISEGWLYLQPIVDRHEVASIIRSVKINDENASEVIEIALCQWAAPEFGYELLLKHQGTCNGITFFDTQIAYQSRSLCQKLAEILVGHLYDELVGNINALVAEQEPGFQPIDQLSPLIANRKWLFSNCGHHLDVTHLASVVRIARHCQSNDSLELALQLCQYGAQLDEQLKYESEPPFENIYHDHLMFFEAMLDKRVDPAIDHFVARHKQLRESEFAESAMSVVNTICSKTARSERAVAFLLTELEPEQIQLPLLFSAAETYDDFEKLKKHFRASGDLLGFGLSGLRQGLVQQ